MQPTSLLTALLFVASASSAPLVQRASEFVYPGDAPYDASAEELGSILHCASPPSAAAPVVLLVHGTGSTGLESWGDGYIPGLIAHGYTPCYLDLPNRSMGDMQVTSAYVAYNMHYLSSMAGGNPVSVISHSQGGPDVQWALRFWPSTRNVVKNFIALSPDMSGVNNSSVLYQLCTLDLTNDLGVKLCTESLWQQAIHSKYYAALNYKKDSFVPTTTLFSTNDTTVPPPETNARLPGATTTSVQALCPNATTDHFGMLVSYAAFLVTLNALKSGSEANVEAVASYMPDNTCSSVSAPGMDYGLVPALTSMLGDLALGILLSGPKTAGEPEIKPYARIENQ